MVEIVQTLLSPVTVRYRVLSSLELVLIHLRHLCNSSYEFPRYQTIDLTNLESDRNDVFHFTINAAKAFTFFVFVNGTLEKTDGAEISVTYDIKVYEAQFAVFSFFALVIPFSLGLVFLRSSLLFALPFFIFPPVILIVAIKRTIKFIEELKIKLQQL